MLDIRFLRENMLRVKEMLARRGIPEAEVGLADFERRDEERRKIIAEVEGLQHKRNVTSQRIATLKKEGKSPDEELKAEMREVGDRVREMESSLKEIEGEVRKILYLIPNIPHDSVPLGAGPEENQEIRKYGEPQFPFSSRPHWEIGEDLKILDFQRAAKVAGRSFPLLVGLGAALERALINFMIDLHTKDGKYKEIWPPFLVNPASMTATGQLPKFAQELFRLADDDYYLVPTAEVPVTNLHRDEVLDADALPIRYVAYTPCFRREAGSYGKETRGLIRQHQFDKVELVEFVRPEETDRELEELTRDAEEVLKKLDLPYRVVVLCTGDLGFAAAKTYDIEVWMPGQGEYKEISSCSSFGDFQARRAQIRYKVKGGKGTRLVHTLNGSGLAVGRCMAAILENFQEADGSVTIPEALRPYMHGIAKIG